MKVSKKEAEKQIEEFFEELKDEDETKNKSKIKTAKDVKKIKKLAMRHNIKLGEKRKLFCKKCYAPYKDYSLRIKNNKVSMTCGKCKHVSRWKVK